MNVWKSSLIVITLLTVLVGFAWLYKLNPQEYDALILLLVAIFLLGSAVITYHYRKRITPELFWANLTSSAIAMLTSSLLLSGGLWLMDISILPTLERHWLYMVIALLGIGASFVAWVNARGRPSQPPLPAALSAEAAPHPTATLPQELAWQPLFEQLSERQDHARLQHLQVLHRLYQLLDKQYPKQSLIDVENSIRQEVMRLAAASEASSNQHEDMLSKTAAFLEWGAQKIPELAELDISDLLMAKTIADIRRLHTTVNHIFVDHRQLRAIHPIDRESADEKCNQRAQAAQDALPLLQSNGMRLSEELIKGHAALQAFDSVTGFQVIFMGEGQGYVTFEGNGRREALHRAFGEDTMVEVEVRLFSFDNPQNEEDIIRRIHRVRRWKEVTD